VGHSVTKGECVIYENIFTGILWAAALGSGLMARIYFAFSAFIMRAFVKLETTQFVAAMNAINKMILRHINHLRR
jgi:uncharacterized membrane protein